MLRVERVELCNWDIQANQIIVLCPGINLITGENGSGKTAILDGIKVALGAGRIGADRSVNDYLGVRDALVAMVRLVATNRAERGTGRRPFDVLGGGFESDQVSLASVFTATDDGYMRRDYILDGDTSPLDPTVEARPFERRADYRARLERLGLGRSFRTLLTTPQGEVANLCKRSPAELFDLLFDFIGGRQALDEWAQLRRDYDRLERRRQDQARGLAESERRLIELHKRREIHLRYLEHELQASSHRLALPLAHVRALTEQHGEQLARARSLQQQAQETDRAYQEQLARRDQARVDLEQEREVLDGLDRRYQRLGEEADGLAEELAEARVRHGELERLRSRAEALPVQDLSRLEQLLEEARARVASTTHLLGELGKQREGLEQELEQVRQGVLPVPGEVRAFRRVLRQQKIPHQLLMDLLDPAACAGDDRAALESFLGDLRLAVAVPDLDSFVRVVELAREHRFPFHVLAPDVRARRPARGEHPFLDAVRVKDPRYQGLVVRLLRRVRHLGQREAVRDTFRELGALVSGEGFVLDRVGGVHRGTDRFYLGRDALERRRGELERALEAIDRRREEVTCRRDEQRREAEQLDLQVEQELLRRRWQERRAEHAQAEAEVKRLRQASLALRGRQEGIEQERRAAQERMQVLSRRVGKLETEAANRAGQSRTLREEAGAARQGAGQLAEELAAREGIVASGQEALSSCTAAQRGEIQRLADVEDPRFLDRALQQYEHELGRYSDDDRDENLPANVRTQQRQVEDVRGELARLDEDTERARAAAEQAHEQYRRITLRVFRRYFAQLAGEARVIGFAVEGQLRDREDGRFEVDLKVGVGEKLPVPYSSSSLSGGERAALSILMGMSTMETGDRLGPGFFIVDEPFSASDTHKIQELGAFLDRTGAQYLVSMPTSMDISRCGGWLRSVLTCTRVAGGVDERGELRLALPVRCSYVEHDEQPEPA